MGAVVGLANFPLSGVPCFRASVPRFRFASRAATDGEAGSGWRPPHRQDRRPSRKIDSMHGKP